MVADGSKTCKYIANLRRTSISFWSDSSLPRMPFLSMHLTATYFPFSILSSASSTSEKAPLMSKNYKCYCFLLDLTLVTGFDSESKNSVTNYWQLQPQTCRQKAVKPNQQKQSGAKFLLAPRCFVYY